MRIGDRPSGQPISGQTNRATTSTSAKSEAKSAESKSSASAVDAEFLGRLKEIPDIRADVLADVERRLADGQLFTRDAAERTATALLAELTSTYQSAGEV